MIGYYVIAKSPTLCYNPICDVFVCRWDIASKGLEVMLMKNFDFKDLMAFGMFLLALLTFIFKFVKNS